MVDALFRRDTNLPLYSHFSVTTFILYSVFLGVFFLAIVSIFFKLWDKRLRVLSFLQKDTEYDRYGNENIPVDQINVFFISIFPEY